MMKYLHGLLLAVSIGLAPTSAFTQDNHSDKEGNSMVKVTMDTSMGVIKLELDAGKAPLTVANFVEYAKSGFYDNTVFHRVIPGFMIQGGGFEPDMKQKTTRASIRNEASNGLKNKAGTIAMARTSDPHSATAQFFISCVDNAFLDFKSETPQGWGYTVFGKVVDGMDTVTRIEKVRTGVSHGMRDVPVEAVVIRKVTIEE
jgi:peptidyl-prolyl cis-trans isomerase B (cyclophilin B)